MLLETYNVTRMETIENQRGGQCFI